MRFDWSPRVQELMKILKPYKSKMGGLKPDAPKEMQELYEECKKLMLEEKWL